MNFGGRIDAQQVVYRGRQIAGGHRVAVGNGTVFVRRTVDGATFHTSAGQQRGTAPWPVVSTDVLVDVRRTAEFADPHGQSVLQQASVFQVI